MDSFTLCSTIFAPVVLSATYTTQIDFYNRHISGLMVFKTMNDTTERVVFMTETGFKFFDFEFHPNGFKVQYIIPSLNKKFIVNTFRNDISYLLIPPIKSSIHPQIKNDTCTLFKFSKSKSNCYYYSNKQCTELHRIEVGTDRKKSLTIELAGKQNKNPETINIVHHSFKLIIFLKQIDTHADSTTPWFLYYW